MTTTSTIRNSFEAAALSYDRRDGIQPAVVQRLLEWLPETLADSAPILEIGCGTGCLTERLRERYPQHPFCALDLSSAMVAAAQRRLAARFGETAGMVWHTADVQTFEPEGAFGLIASSSALHWVRPLPEALARLAGWLTPGGQLVFALMTEGTLAELHLTRQAVAPGKAAAGLTLPEGQAVVTAAQRAGLAVQAAAEREMQVRMPSARDLLRMLSAQGTAAGIYGSALNRTELARLIHEYDRTHAAPGGGVLVTWRVLYLKAVKQAGGAHSAIQEP